VSKHCWHFISGSTSADGVRTEHACCFCDRRIKQKHRIIYPSEGHGKFFPVSRSDSMAPLKYEKTPLPDGECPGAK